MIYDINESSKINSNRHEKSKNILFLFDLLKLMKSSTTLLSYEHF